MVIAFLALGSNIEPEKNIFEAVKLLAKQVKILQISTVYLTEPLGRKNQSKYYNCVLKIETDLTPKKLKFDVLRNMEKALGRKRVKDKYAPRTIDIDLILFDNLQLVSEDLILPDPDICKRAFYAIPLLELEPELTLPPKNMSIKEIADKFKKNELIELKDYTETLQHLAE